MVGQSGRRGLHVLPNVVPGSRAGYGLAKEMPGTAKAQLRCPGRAIPSPAGVNGVAGEIGRSVPLAVELARGAGREIVWALVLVMVNRSLLNRVKSIPVLSWRAGMSGLVGRTVMIQASRRGQEPV